MIDIILKHGKEESVKRFHPWIFSGAIHHITGQPAEGELARILSAEGEYLATGHYQSGSIMVRILTFDNEPINQAFFEHRLLAAWRMRQNIGLAPDADNNTFRLVHGEGDNLPGLVIDIYGPTAVVQAHSAGMHHSRQTIAAALLTVCGDLVRHIYYKSEGTLPAALASTQPDGYLAGGHDSAADIAVESGLKFHVDWVKGQKTGFFIDQRDSRRLLQRYSAGRRALNMFCYTGGFTLHALRGGATLVHSVDSSLRATRLTEANVSLNFPGDTRHQAFAEDAFRFLQRITEPYDLVVLDPPAFAKHKDSLRNALKGYTRLNRTALEKMPAGSILFTFSCSQAVNKDQFRAAVFTAAAQARRSARVLHQLHQPADHPVNIYHPEGEYLKGLVLYVE